MRINPAEIPQSSYYDAPFPFNFTFTDGEGGAFTIPDSVEVRYFSRGRQNNPEVTLSIGGGLTVAGNQISGQLSAENTKSFWNKVVFYEWRFFADAPDDRLVVVNGRHVVSNVPDGASGSDATVAIKDNAVTVESVGIISIAQAIIAKDAAETAKDETIAAADQAIIDIGTAKDSAIVDVNAARDAGLTAINNAETQGVDAVNAAKDAAIIEINALVTQAEGFRDEAQGFAGDADTAKTGAETAQGLSETARDESVTAKTGSETARDKSQEWAQNPEDTPVETGQFSALHWSAKSEGHAGTAETQANRAESEADRAFQSAETISNTLVQLGVVLESHRDYVYATIGSGGEIQDPVKTKELFES